MSIEKLTTLFFQAVQPETPTEEGLKTIDFCIQVGINVDQVNPCGDTALIVTGRNNKKEIFKKLFAAGADINKCDVGNRSAFMHAVRFFDVETLKDFISKGANVNHKDQFDVTPLMCATGNPNPGVIKLLIENKADLFATNCNGETILMGAVKDGTIDDIQLIVDAGAEINQTNVFGETALFYAVRSKKEENVKLLLDLGADICPKDANKDTALSIDKKLGNQKIIDLLVEAEKKKFAPIVAGAHCYTPSKGSILVVTKNIFAKAPSTFKILSSKVELPHGIIFDGTMKEGKPQDGTLTFPVDTKLSVTVNADGKFVLNL
jgi:ankyrin repeat protein